MRAKDLLPNSERRKWAIHLPSISLLFTRQTTRPLLTPRVFHRIGDALRYRPQSLAAGQHSPCATGKQRAPQLKAQAQFEKPRVYFRYLLYFSLRCLGGAHKILQLSRREGHSFIRSVNHRFVRTSSFWLEHEAAEPPSCQRRAGGAVAQRTNPAVRNRPPARSRARSEAEFTPPPRPLPRHTFAPLSRGLECQPPLLCPPEVPGALKQT